MYFATIAKDPFAQVPKLSVFGVVRRLREQRYYMVQSQSQYEFIYTYINNWIDSYGLNLPNAMHKPLVCLKNLECMPDSTTSSAQ